MRQTAFQGYIATGDGYMHSFDEIMSDILKVSTTRRNISIGVPLDLSTRKRSKGFEVYLSGGYPADQKYDCCCCIFKWHLERVKVGTYTVELCACRNTLNFMNQLSITLCYCTLCLCIRKLYYI